MDTIPPLVNQPPRRTGWIVYSTIVTLLLFVSGLLNLALLFAVFGPGGHDTALSRHRAHFEEEYIDGDADSHNKIVVIQLAGIISMTGEEFAGESGMVGEIKEQLRQAVEDKQVKAIVLRINSPGGEVVASDEIYQAVVDARDSKKVVACIDSMGASGAYYVAVGADYIVANELSITGSIGVILQSYTFSGLMDKVGVKSYTFKSGKYKDLLNPAREPTEAETNLVQTLIMEVYDRFVGIVARERDLKVEDLKARLADGRILSGKQAAEAKLVDEVGYFEDAIDQAKKLADVKKAKIVRYIQPFSWRNVLRLFAKNDRARIQVQLGPQQLKLESGKLYFLPANLFE